MPATVGGSVSCRRSDRSGATILSTLIARRTARLTLATLRGPAGFHQSSRLALAPLALTRLALAPLALAWLALAQLALAQLALA
jgi:hypothetical protein